MQPTTPAFFRNPRTDDVIELSLFREDDSRLVRRRFEMRRFPEDLKDVLDSELRLLGGDLQHARLDESLSETVVSGRIQVRFRRAVRAWEALVLPSEVGVSITLRLVLRRL